VAMTKLARGIPLLLALLGLASPARALLIDAFAVPQLLSGAQSSGAPVTSQVSGDMLGGARTMAVGGVLPGFAATGSVGVGALTSTQSAPGQRFVDLIWEADDPIDLTEGGAISAFEIEVESFSGITNVYVNVFSDPIALLLSQGREWSPRPARCASSQRVPPD
jgi:hypothetical protein